jgi:hypothetical protein
MVDVINVSRSTTGGSTIPVAELGSGTPTGSKFLRDDGTWALPPSGEGGGPHATNHQNNGTDEISVAGLSGLLADAQTPLSHTHAEGDVTGLTAALAGKSDVGHTHPGGSGAPALVIPILRHFTTLEMTCSANATWKIPAATTYGQAAVLLDMTKLGSPASAALVIVYTNTATTGTNQIGFTLGSTPRAAGTTVTQVASSAVTMANTSTYPQTIEKAITISELGSTKQWLQLCLNIATSTVGPNVFSADLILYY